MPIAIEYNYRIHRYLHEACCMWISNHRIYIVSSLFPQRHIYHEMINSAEDFTLSNAFQSIQINFGQAEIPFSIFSGYVTTLGNHTTPRIDNLIRFSTRQTLRYHSMTITLSFSLRIMFSHLRGSNDITLSLYSGPP